MMVQVYSGGEEVELFQNGKSLGRMPCGMATAFEAAFNTEYQPGELLAVTYDHGEEIGSCVLNTAEAVDNIYIDIENGRKLVFLNIELRDP